MIKYGFGRQGTYWYKRIVIQDLNSFSPPIQSQSIYTQEIIIIFLITPTTWGRPQTPTDLEYSEVNYESANIYWTSGYDMGTTQRFTIYRMFSSNTYTKVSTTINSNVIFVSV